MILDDYRDELDLEFRWLNPPPPEMKKKWKIYEQMKRKKTRKKKNTWGKKL